MRGMLGGYSNLERSEDAAADNHAHVVTVLEAVQAVITTILLMRLEEQLDRAALLQLVVMAQELQEIRVAVVAVLLAVVMVSLVAILAALAEWR
jgi:uncharacterized membrane protein